MKCKYRFFKGEEANPFDQDRDYSRFVFWREEKAYSALPAHEKQRMLEMYREALAEGCLSLDLADAGKPEVERVVLFYADLHCGRLDPYGHQAVDWTLYFSSPTS